VDRSPDVLMVLAGDGTARTAAEMCGVDGPLVAPLPGGTMNLLPRAVYGTTDWQAALKATLDEGISKPIGGGQVEGHTFLVGAILGSPALWAPAREAIREMRVITALRRARHAYRRAFSGRLRVAFDAGARGKAEAVTFICPLASKALPDEEQALEAAVLDLSGALDAFRLGVHAIVGDWRKDPKVEVVTCRRARAWAASGIPALLDGEPVRLKSVTEVHWRPCVANVLAPPEEHGV
jgi:diacylglycerol kinase family enzyme